MARAHYPLPPYTCPVIDGIRSVLGSVYTDLESVGEETDGGTLADVLREALGDLDVACRELEIVRRANAELRSAAENYRTAYEEGRTEREGLERECERLKQEMLEF